MTDTTSAPAATPAAKPRWLLRRPSPDAQARVFCFPYSGVGASMFHRWPRSIDGVEVCLIQLPGRENRIRDPHHGTYEQLARDLVEFLPPYLDKPYGIFGHCGGALAAVELANQLEAAGLPVPRRLFPSAQVAAHDGPYGRFLGLDREELGVELSKLITSLGGTPTPALISMGAELLDRDLDANRTYRVDGPRKVSCGVTAIGWAQDVEIPAEMMGGWAEISADFRSVLLEGGHYDFLGAPQGLLTAIRDDLLG
ncbi:thioesterase II family protein [Streptomyces laurentii]|uniref:thioesterase II family protein n=1 Tax=Streptomyces laurentii TaxID=39478 RepID=UPI0036AECA52